MTEDQIRELARELIAQLPITVKMSSKEWQLLEDRFATVIQRMAINGGYMAIPHPPETHG